MRYPIFFANFWAASVFAISSAFAQGQTQDIGMTVFRKASGAVVVVKARSPSATLQGSGVGYRYGYGANSKPDSTWVATNAHVVEGAVSVAVQVGDAQHKATVEYIDPELDLALLKVSGLVIAAPAAIQSTEQAQVGSRVFAIGSPLGLENTITEGIVSGLRDRKGVRVIQTSAAISRGNSGGGLFNSDGRLLGVTTFKLQGGENLNFAVDGKYVLAIDQSLFAANMIRASYERKAVRPGDENDLEERYIESPALPKWLFGQKAADGTPMYQYVDRAINRSIRSGGKLFGAGDPDFDALLRSYLQTRPRASATPTQAGQKAANESFRLTCPMHATNDGSFQFDLNVTVDPRASTVNGFPAQITEAEIQFKSGKDAAFTAILDRYTGRVSVGNERFPRLLNGTCSRVLERQF